MKRQDEVDLIEMTFDTDKDAATAKSKSQLKATFYELKETASVADHDVNRDRSHTEKDVVNRSDHISYSGTTLTNYVFGFAQSHDNQACEHVHQPMWHNAASFIQMTSPSDSTHDSMVSLPGMKKPIYY